MKQIKTNLIYVVLVVGVLLLVPFIYMSLRPSFYELQTPELQVSILCEYDHHRLGNIAILCINNHKYLQTINGVNRTISQMFTWDRVIGNLVPERCENVQLGK